MEILPGENEVILRYNDDALDRYILRKCTKAGGVTNERMPKSAFLAIHQSTMRNAGYLCGTSIHTIRRELGKRVDGKDSHTLRARILVTSVVVWFSRAFMSPR
jgi:hypothetical protein